MEKVRKQTLDANRQLNRARVRKRRKPLKVRGDDVHSGAEEELESNSQQPFRIDDSVSSCAPRTREAAGAKKGQSVWWHKSVPAPSPNDRIRD